MEKEYPVMFIVNPYAGHWRVRREWERLRPRLLEEFRRFSSEIYYDMTASPDDFQRIVENAHELGVKLLVPVGGDGTVHWTVNAMVSLGLLEEMTVYPFQIGTGGDWSRSLGLPSGYGARLDGLKSLGLRRVDLMKVRLDEEIRYVANVGSVGLGGDVVAEVREYEKRHPWTYLMAVVHSLRSANPARVSVETDDGQIFAGPVVVVAVANGSTFGSGIPIAPDAKMDDGILDVVLIRHLPFAKALVSLPLLYARQHSRIGEVSFHESRSVSVKGLGGTKMKMELDGEYVESTEAEFSVVPSALQVWLPGERR